MPNLAHYRNDIQPWSWSRSNISRAMLGRIPKIQIFPALRNQRISEQANAQSEFVLPQHSASPSALRQVASATPKTQNKRASYRNRRSTSCYGFENSSSDSTITAPPKRLGRAGDIKNFQPHLYRWLKRYSQLLISYPRWTTSTLLLGNVTTRPTSLSSCWSADSDSR